MKNSLLKWLSVIILLFSSVTFADLNDRLKQYTEREYFYDFQAFYQNLPILNQPFDTKNLPKGIYIDSQFFHYDDDYSYYNDPTDKTYRYFTLQDLKAIGRFEQDTIKFVLFNFSYESEGEAFVYDIYLLNAFNENNEYLDNLVLAGRMGHEDHSFTFSSKVDDNLFQVHLEDDYEVVYFTGSFDGERTHRSQIDLNYEFKDEQFRLKKRQINCNTLNLKQYKDRIVKRQFANAAEIVQIYDYIECYPVSENIKTYQSIVRGFFHYYFLSDNEYQRLNIIHKSISKDD